MYRFQVNAHTQLGEQIVLVGTSPALGDWDTRNGIVLQSDPDRYPLWSAEVDLPASSGSVVDYKYLRRKPNGQEEWESWGENRWVPVETESFLEPIVVDDGVIGFPYPEPYGYFETPVPKPLLPKSPQGLKVVVFGSSVALGCSAWLLRGWAWRLEQALHQRYGHQLVNRSLLGANVSQAIANLPQVLEEERPDIVILALSLGNEGFAKAFHSHFKSIQHQFERGLHQLVRRVQEFGAFPVLGSVYPHADYTPRHYPFLLETHERMLSWGVPVLNWLTDLDNGQGQWKTGLSFDVAHPNTEGQRVMYEAINLDIFNLNPASLTQKKQQLKAQGLQIYSDQDGFQVVVPQQPHSLLVKNPSSHPYSMGATWPAIQNIFYGVAHLNPGLYVAKNTPLGTTPSFWVTAEGTLAKTVNIPPNADVDYQSVPQILADPASKVLFYDGQIGLVKCSDRHLYVLNETPHEYNVHPMWKDVRHALSALPAGVYEDAHHPDAPFRTLMIGQEGLESRIKVPGKTSLLFQYRCPLSELDRVALIPLGARCAARMLLYKMEYDGPAYPFDLTRTTNLGDVADIIANNFTDMWNPELLHYSHEARRIFHTKWTGLSFAHEVEDYDDPINNVFPVFERMKARYTKRSQRFWYTVKHCDKALFIRAGFTTRGYVIDIMHKLEDACEGKPFRLMLLSPQPSDEFADLPNVLHYPLDFNPDRMYEDLDYWQSCTKVMKNILTSLGISSQNLFWCPPNPPAI